ncbi:hypothetical protein BH23BAC1_BH23BAC1_42750 [soil metagenome]
MKIFIIGSGKLANAINTSGLSFPSCEIIKWENKLPAYKEKSIIIHAGSGRQLQEGLEFCKRTDSFFIELSTGLITEELDPNFTLIICPNTSLLLLKTLSIFRFYGSHFKEYKISIIESHQSSKRSIPGTAFSFAKSLSVPFDQIKSIRQKDIQIHKIGIPNEFLDIHAYHKIVIQDGLDEVIIETKVLGHESYAKGVERIINAVLSNNLEKKKYSILDLIDAKLL